MISVILVDMYSYLCYSFCLPFYSILKFDWQERTCNVNICLVLGTILIGECDCCRNILTFLISIKVQAVIPNYYGIVIYRNRASYSRVIAGYDIVLLAVHMMNTH